MNKQISTKRTAQKAPGCFRISKSTVGALVSCASQQQILSYLPLALHTDASGHYSTAGRSALEKYLCTGKEQGDRNLGSLFALKDFRKGPAAGTRLVFSADEWAAVSGDDYQNTNPRWPVRFYLPQLDADGEYAWFSNNLIQGYELFKNPLLRLKSLGELATRLLLALYLYDDMFQFGGVLPYKASRRYGMINQAVGKNGFQLWHCIPDLDGAIFDIALACTVLRTESLGTTEVERKLNLDSLSDALESLISAGFIYEVITVFDGNPGPEANVIQELDVRSGYGFKPKGENGVGGKTARLAGLWKKPVSKRGARFVGDYAAVVHAGTKPGCAGIFRLRFRVSNPKNYGVSQAFARIYNDQKSWDDKLDDLIREFQAD